MKESNEKSWKQKAESIAHQLSEINARHPASENDSAREGSDSKSGGRGKAASKPTEIPKSGWFDIVKRVKSQLEADNVQIVSAGVAFYFFLALFPAITAFISIYGLVVEPSQAQDHIDQLAAMLPEKVHEMIGDIATTLAGQSGGALGWGMALSLLISLWSANKGAKALFQGLNIVYEEKDERNFFTQNGITLLVTLGGMVTFMVLIGLVVVFPALSSSIGLPSAAATAIGWLRWPLMALIVMLCLSILYKVGPDRSNARMKWVSAGSIFATIVWLLGSWAFSLYVDNFGSYGNTYGSFAAVIILMLWFFLTAFIVLIGAEINSEMEHQTARDTTVGPDRPRGRRGAYQADRVASPAEES